MKIELIKQKAYYSNGGRYVNADEYASYLYGGGYGCGVNYYPAENPRRIKSRRGFPSGLFFFPGLTHAPYRISPLRCAGHGLRLLRSCLEHGPQ